MRKIKESQKTVFFLPSETWVLSGRERGGCGLNCVVRARVKEIGTSNPQLGDLLIQSLMSQFHNCGSKERL
jgi:hypothetical protein